MGEAMKTSKKASSTSLTLEWVIDTPSKTTMKMNSVTKITNDTFLILNRIILCLPTIARKKLEGSNNQVNYRGNHAF